MTVEAWTAFALRWGLDPNSPGLAAALTHPSADPVLGGQGERLEFLGDALLGAMVALRLVNELPASTDEGTLTRARGAVVRRETLAAVARRQGIDRLLLVGDNLRRQLGLPSGGIEPDRLLADAVEALLAVIHLEAGADAAERFVDETLGEEIAAVVADPPGPDPKNAFQERVQQGGGPTPTYRLVAHEAQGDRHRFEVEVEVSGVVAGQGEGASRRDAERAAARDALTGWTQDPR